MIMKRFKKVGEQMTILALDTSTRSTGYCVMADKHIQAYGTIVPPKRFELLDRIIFIEKEIKELIYAKSVEFVAIEELVSFRNASSTRALLGLLMHLQIELKKKNVLTMLTRPSEWRKSCGISGKRREEYKANAIKHVKDVYNLNVNDDEADAICIAEWASGLEVI